MAEEEGSYSGEQTDVEREIFQRELDSFVPDRVLDAHAHMWPGTAPDAGNQPKPWLQEHMTLGRWRELMTAQMPGRTKGIHGLAPTTDGSARRHAEHNSRRSRLRPVLPADYVRHAANGRRLR